LSTSAAPFNRYSFDDDPASSIPAQSMSHLSTEPNSRNRRKHRNIHSHSRVNETRSFALDRFKARRSLFAWLFLPPSFGATEVLSPQKISLYFCLLNRNGHIFFLICGTIIRLPWTHFRGRKHRRPTLKPNLISRCTAPPSDQRGGACWVQSGEGGKPGHCG
jgi:hypothetical protein